MVYIVILLYESGNSKILTSSYLYSNVGAVEVNKTMDNKGVTTGHFRGKGKLFFYFYKYRADTGLRSQNANRVTHQGWGTTI